MRAKLKKSNFHWVYFIAELWDVMVYDYFTNLNGYINCVCSFVQILQCRYVKNIAILQSFLSHRDWNYLLLCIVFCVVLLYLNVRANHKYFTGKNGIFWSPLPFLHDLRHSLSPVLYERMWKLLKLVSVNFMTRECWTQALHRHSRLEPLWQHSIV